MLLIAPLGCLLRLIYEKSAPGVKRVGRPAGEGGGPSGARGRSLAWTLAALLLHVPAPARAGAPPAAGSPPTGTPTRAVTLDAEVGAVTTTGNTRTRSVNAGLAVLRESRRWRHGARAEALYADDRGQTTAQRFVVTAKSDYRFTALDYVFATARYENDRFSGFDYRVSEATGYGRRLAHGRRVTLDVEAGPGGRHSRRDDGRHEDDLIGRAAAGLAVRLGERSTFTEDVTVEAGESGSVTESVTALKAEVAGNLAMKLSFTVRHRSKVPRDRLRTDTVTAVTLVYGF